MSRSVSVVQTAHASRYLQQLSKHWSHKFEVEFDSARGRIDLGEGRICEMEANAEALTVRATAPEDTLDRFQDVVAAHILRFAHREPDLAFVWTREN